MLDFQWENDSTGANVPKVGLICLLFRKKILLHWCGIFVMVPPGSHLSFIWVLNLLSESDFINILCNNVSHETARSNNQQDPKIHSIGNQPDGAYILKTQLLIVL